MNLLAVRTGVYSFFLINQSKSVLTCIRGCMLLLAYFTRFPAFGLNSDWFIGFWYPCCDWLERFPYLVYKSKLVLSCTFTFLHLISPGTKLQYALLLVEREILHIYRTSAGERYRTIPTALSLAS